MTQKVFVERGRVKLVGDPRGFLVDRSQRTEYKAWCKNNAIETSFQGSMGGVDLWYVKNDKDRMLVLLRWT